jgi:hypothetical protein
MRRSNSLHIDSSLLATPGNSYQIRNENTSWRSLSDPSFDFRSVVRAKLGTTAGTNQIGGGMLDPSLCLWDSNLYGGTGWPG